MKQLGYPGGGSPPADGQSMRLCPRAGRSQLAEVGCTGDNSAGAGADTLDRMYASKKEDGKMNKGRKARIFMQQPQGLGINLGYRLEEI